MAQVQVRKTDNCAKCGRKLGVGYYWKCHICGLATCYAHIPPDHRHTTA